MAPRPDDPFAPRRDDDPQPASQPQLEFRPGIPPPFRLDSASVARIPLRAERDVPPLPDAFVPRRYPRDRVWLHVGLFLVTLVTATLVGAEHWASFVSDFGQRRIVFNWSLLANGLWYSLTILAILGAHESGHYLACRFYRINASLPYFIPLPPPFFTGTLGAFIRIRQPFRGKRELFDVGIAGPLAGFVVAVPALFLGIALSTVGAVPKDFSGLELGEPLLFKITTWLLKGSLPAGQSVNMHPVAFAAWFGLLATSLNLFPIGQLDGGHISYAVLGRMSRWITLGGVAVAIVLTFFSPSWILWAVMMVAMLYFFGAQHPPVIDERVPLDRARLVLAVLALVIFVLTFMPAPMNGINLK